MDRLQSMRVFAKVVEQGSFSRAAQALALSSAVVTRLVADLEKHLGARLLNRTTRKLSLTETGTAYLERVVQILHEIDDAEAIASSQASRPYGLLRVYAHPGFTYQLSKLLPQYAQRHPGVTIDVRVSDRTIDLVEERLDVGFFIGIQKIAGTMIVRQLGLSEAVICASPEYVKRHGALRTPEDIAHHACLNFSYEQLRQAWPLKQPDGRTVHVNTNNTVISNNGELLRNLALAGMGIMIGPSYALGDDLASARLVRLLPGHHLGEISVVMAYPSRHLLPAKVRSFIDFISAHYPRPEVDPWLHPSSGLEGRST